MALGKDLVQPHTSAKRAICPDSSGPFVPVGEPGLNGRYKCPRPLVPVLIPTGTDGVPRGHCGLPRQGGLLSRLVAPTGTNKLPRVSSSVAWIFFSEKGEGVWGFCRVNLGVSYIVLAR